ncbi:MAG: hypothetical protein Q9M36_14395 [Sulfurovum sp.]|nr:hypothetical protein [Sulfurovum sp.]
MGLALLCFNIGVEIGQLFFVTSIVLLVLLLERLKYPSLLDTLQTILVYIIGGISAFWLIERLLSF